MLIRRLIAVMILAALASIVLAGPAAADGGGDCDHNPDPSCITWGGGGGNDGGGSGSGGGSGGGCSWQGQSVPCQDPDYGYYVGGGCYWQALNPAPVAAPPAGKDPAKGAWGVRSCYTAPNSGVATQVYYWMDDPNAGPTPAELAQQALAKIHLLGARIGIAPRPGGSGAVGLPVWLWTAVTPGTWGPLSASASGGGITVTVTAKASRIVWRMGDGGQVVCANPGTAYQARHGMASSPTCGYTYSTPSSTTAHPHGRYTITATTYWTVNWSGGGQTGVLNPTSQSQTNVEIGEIQVVGQ
jgi:hypothetical protein